MADEVGRLRGTGAVEARTERKCTPAGAGDRGARVRLACRVGGPGRMPPGHGQPLSFRLERSRSTAHRSCAICVPERQAHHGRQGAGATSTRLPATGAAILVFSLSAMPTRPHCGYGCGDDQVVHKENDVTPVSYVLHLVDLGSTIFLLTYYLLGRSESGRFPRVAAHLSEGRRPVGAPPSPRRSVLRPDLALERDAIGAMPD